MNESQLAAFEGATGVTAADLTLAVAGVMAVSMLLWLAWIALANFKLWQDGRIGIYDLIWNIVRGAIMTLLLGYIIR